SSHTLTLSTSYSCPAAHPKLHSSPTRRSSDLLFSSGGRLLRTWDTQELGLDPLDCAHLSAAEHLRFGRSPRARFDFLNQHRVLRSEEHTSELQSPCNFVCRLLLEKKSLAHLVA